MVNLKTSYMGIPLKNPIIAGASALSGDLANLKRIEEAGAGALVIKSLFEEEVQLSTFEFDEDRTKFDGIHAEMTSIYPEIEHSGPKEHLYWVKKAKEALSIPVIASLNAVNLKTWVEYAKALEKTGVDGLELNFYSIPKTVDTTGETIEQEQIEILKQVKAAVSIPVSVKLSPYYSSISHFTNQLDQQGVDALILFNRLFQPEIDANQEEERTAFELSQSKDHQLPLRWTALLSGQLKADIISSTGILTGTDVIKMILVGAQGVQVVSTLYLNKIEHITKMIRDMEKWMIEKGYRTLEDFRGKLAKNNMKDPWAYERSQYIKMLMTKKTI